MQTFLLILCFLIASGIFFIGWCMLTAVLDVENDQKEYLSKHDLKEIKANLKSKHVLNAVMACMLLCSCTQTAKMKHYHRIHGIDKSGVYHLKSKINDTVTFKGIAGTYTLYSNTITRIK